MKKFNYKKKFKGYICPNPFIYAEIQENGNISTCCYISENFGNINENNIEEIWNSNKFNDLRESLVDGDFSYCDISQCAAMQNIFQVNNNSFEYQVPYQLMKKEDAYFLNKDFITPEILSFEEDPSCNLSCPSCRKSLIILDSNESTKKINQQIKLLIAIGANLKELWLCGAGDPFAASSYKNLLSNFDWNIVPNAKLRIDTNGLLLNETTWNTTLKTIQNRIDLIAVSVDATTNKTYSIVRRGGNFTILLKNLEFLSNLRDSGFKFSYIIRMIVQKENFNEMIEFVKLGLSLNVDSIVFSEIQNWGTFSNEEYLMKAVHLDSNVFYNELCEILQNNIFKNPKIDLGNLNSLYAKVNSE